MNSNSLPHVASSGHFSWLNTAYLTCQLGLYTTQKSLGVLRSRLTNKTPLLAKIHLRGFLGHKVEQLAHEKLIDAETLRRQPNQSFVLGERGSSARRPMSSCVELGGSLRTDSSSLNQEGIWRIDRSETEREASG